MAFNRMSSEELRLAKLWYDEDGKAPLEISQLLRRDKSTITRHVVKRTHQLFEAGHKCLIQCLGNAAFFVKVYSNHQTLNKVPMRGVHSITRRAR